METQKTEKPSKWFTDKTVDCHGPYDHGTLEIEFSKNGEIYSALLGWDSNSWIENGIGMRYSGILSEVRADTLTQLPLRRECRFGA